MRSIRTRLLSLAAIPAVALAVGLTTAGAASAADNANKVTLYSDADQCGGAPATAHADVGFVNLHQDGQTVTVIYHLKNGVPGATYYVSGYSGYCNYDGFLGTVVPNSNGVANATFTYTIPAADTTVWIFSIAFPSGGGFDTAETPAVTP